MVGIIGIVAAMILLTTSIHALFMFAGLWIVHYLAPRPERRKHLRGSLIVACFVFLMFLASVVEAFAWSLLYLAEDQIPVLLEALYFSMVTFTTLGYGDIVLTGNWRIVASFQASVGLIMFGWTTALVVKVVDDVFSSKL